MNGAMYALPHTPSWPGDGQIYLPLPLLLEFSMEVLEV